ncbi:hypothetical protein [Paenibacillus cymbidii]|uniref:hypothetical protein n=1 Tax=Paenibacillus cymbidii TaxID=1639034 RepID=UPI001081FBEE|nr:hypothetical protein [Paenibacillus cymbidii]
MVAKYLSKSDIHAIMLLKQHFSLPDNMDNSERLIIDSFFDRFAPLIQAQNSTVKPASRKISKILKSKCRAAGCTNKGFRYGLCKSCVVQFHLVDISEVEAIEEYLKDGGPE